MQNIFQLLIQPFNLKGEHPTLNDSGSNYSNVIDDASDGKSLNEYTKQFLIKKMGYVMLRKNI